MSKSLEGFSFNVKPKLTQKSKAEIKKNPEAEPEYESLVFQEEDFRKMEVALKIDKLADEYRLRLQDLRDVFLLLHRSWELAPPLGMVRKQLKKISSDIARLTETLELMNICGVAENVEEAAMQSSLIRLKEAATSETLENLDASAATLFETLLRGEAESTEEATIQTSLRLLKDAAVAEGLKNPYKSMTALLEILNQVDLAAKRAASELPKGTRGRPPSLPLERLVWGLDSIFTEITGAKGVVSTRPNWTAKVKRSRDDKEPTGTEQYYGMILDFAEAFLLPLKEHFPMQRQTLGYEIKRIQKEVRTRKTKVE
jgi:hypothetical protein